MFDKMVFDTSCKYQFCQSGKWLPKVGNTDFYVVLIDVRLFSFSHSKARGFCVVSEDWGWVEACEAASFYRLHKVLHNCFLGFTFDRKCQKIKKGAFL